MPVNVNDCGLPRPSLVTVTTALRAPVAEGLNVTLTVQDVACVRDVQVLAVIANSAALLLVTWKN